MPSPPRSIESLIVDVLRWMAGLGGSVQAHAIAARYGQADADRVLEALLKHGCVEYDLKPVVDAQGNEMGLPRHVYALTAKGLEKARSFDQ